MKRIGIFGGTFNPIHYGHLINAELVREEFSLDKIFFVPSKIPVHKSMPSPKTSPNDRFNMILKSIEGNDNFDVSREEMDRESPSYTIITLRNFKNKFKGAEIYFIMGEDAFDKLETWHCYEEILKLCKIIILTREAKTDKKENEVDHHRIIFFNNPNIEISSTEIRERILQNKTVKYMTPDSVIEYIEKTGQYQN